MATVVVLCILPLCWPRPLSVSALPATQLLTPGLHRLINSPTNTPGFPAVIARSYFVLPW
jgi:hypothetical protein